MTLRMFDDSVASQKHLTGSVCIVGAGVAGLIAATRLARKNKALRVVVVESGLTHADPAISALNNIDNPSNNYTRATEARCRGLGGTSLLWAGKLLPLSRHDTDPRPYIELPGWPFDIAELAPYQRELESLMRVDREPLEESITEHLDPRSLLSRNNPDFCLRWPKRPSSKNHNLAYVLRRDIETLDNLDVWLSATASGFDVDMSSGKIRSLTITNHSRRSVKVLAHEYLIAAGTLESTRLLLLADRHANHLISRESDALGRYFNDHFGLESATLCPLDHALTNRMLSDRLPYTTLRHLHFELRPAVQERHRIGSAYFDIAVELPDSSSLAGCKRLSQSFKRADFKFPYSDMKTIFRDSPSLFKTMHWHYLRKQKYWHPNARLRLKIWVEQLPRRNNRILLSERLDALQMPLLKLEMNKTDAEELTFRTMVETVDRYWSASFAHACRLQWRREVSDPTLRIVDIAGDQAHPAGSTRMGNNPADSVIDSRLKVHRIPNLSVASASAFPSSGSANPTFTIMQLAMRASDALQRRLSTNAAS